MAPKQMIDSDMLVKGGVIAAGVLGFIFVIKQLKK